MSSKSLYLRCSWLTLGALVCALAMPAGWVRADEHPLVPELALLEEAIERVESEVRDYSCKFIKRERVNGKLLDHQIIYLRVRHQPFSVYMYFLAPDDVKGRQVVYIAGKNDGNLLALSEGLVGKLGPILLAPDSPLAMEDQRYPITNVGMLNLMKLFHEVCQADQQHDGCRVRRVNGAKVGKRACTVTEVVHPEKRDGMKYHKARIFFDNELQVPIRFEAYLWPEKDGEEPPLLEEYMYTNLKLNQDYEDDDFTIRLNVSRKN